MGSEGRSRAARSLEKEVEGVLIGIIAVDVQRRRPIAQGPRCKIHRERGGLTRSQIGDAQSAHREVPLMRAILVDRQSRQSVITRVLDLDRQADCRTRRHRTKSSHTAAINEGRTAHLFDRDIGRDEVADVDLSSIGSEQIAICGHSNPLCIPVNGRDLIIG